MVLEQNSVCVCVCPIFRRSSFNIDTADIVIKYARGTHFQSLSTSQILLSTFLSLFCGFWAASNDQLLKKTTYSEKKAVSFQVQFCPEIPFHTTEMITCDCFSSVHPVDISEQSSGFSFMITFPLQTLLDVGGLQERGKNRGNTKTGR